MKLPSPAWLASGSVVAVAAAVVAGGGDARAGTPWRDLALALPIVLVGLARAAPHPWGCSIMAAVYSAFVVALELLLPPCPTSYKVTHFVPPALPLLLLGPAAALDLLRPVESRWREALALATLFFAGVAVVRWPAAEVLRDPWVGVGLFAARVR